MSIIRMHARWAAIVAFVLALIAIGSVKNIQAGSSQSASRIDVFDLTQVGKDSHWKIFGRTASVEQVKGRRALKISEGSGNGVVWLDGYHFTNGVIDVNVLGRSQPIQGSFVGVAFRVVDGQTHDAVYFRPFNFRASEPVRRNHAVQYVSDPEWTWDKLRSERSGQYEHPVVPAPDGDEWFHARVVVERPKVSVFVNNVAEPCLVVNELSDRSDGSVGLWVGNGSGGYFDNLHVTREAVSTDQGVKP